MRMGRRWVAVRPVIVVAALMTLPALGAGACGSRAEVPAADATSLPADPTPMLQCFGTPFPVTALQGPANAEQGTDPADQALSAWLAHQNPNIGAPMTGWVRLRMDADSAEYRAMDATGTEATSLRFERHGDTWTWAGSGGCGTSIPVAVAPGAETRWALDPAYPPPSPTDRVVHVRVSRLTCNDGRMVAPEEVHPPVVTVTDQSITVLYTSDPVPPGMHSCPGPMGTALTLDLGQPRGTRTLLDGSTYPARPVTASEAP